MSKSVKFKRVVEEGTATIVYPDEPSLFSNLDLVGDYLYADYTGTMDLAPDDRQPIKPKIQLTNFVVKSGDELISPQGGIYWIGTDDKLEVTADVIDESGVLASIMSASGETTVSMVIITQEVFNGDYSNVKDSTRFKVDITNNVMTLVSNKGFGLSGNYIVTQERLNLGLDNLGATFRVEMGMIEFDVLNR